MKHALLCLLLFAGPLWGQEVVLELKGDIEKSFIEKVIVKKEPILVAKSLPFSVHAPAGGFGYIWDYPEAVVVQRRGAELRVLNAPKGNLIIAVEFSVVDFKAQKVDTRFGAISFAVGEVMPPDPPKPPGPPLPPAPVGFRVIIVHETADDSKLPIGQFSAMTSKKVTDYLSAKCIDGKQGWRKWDKDQKVENESALWKNLWATARPVVGTLPAVIITVNEQIMVDPATMQAFVVPASVDEMLALLARFGG